MNRCEYCGLLLDSECPNPAEHERLNSMREVHWRELAERPPVRRKPCRAEYERPGGREREDRIVRCGRTEGHDGPHREFDGAPEWETA